MGPREMKIEGGEGSILPSQLFSMDLKIKVYKTLTLAVVLYGCETWSLTLNGKCRLRVFKDRNPRRIFGLKKNASREWRRLQNEELHSLYRAPNTV